MIEVRQIWILGTYLWWLERRPDYTIFVHDKNFLIYHI